MNPLQKIISILTNPNAELTNIIISPFFIVEVFIYVNMFITLLNIKPNKKSKYICMFCLLISVIVSKTLIPVPYNTIFNALIFVWSYLYFFKTNLIGTFIGVIIPFLLTTLFEMISSQIYTLIFNQPYSEALTMPLYYLVFLLIVYSCLFLILYLLKKFNLNISTFITFDKKDCISTLVTIALGFITIFLQLYITAFYTNILPHFIIILSIICLIAYFFVSLFNVVKTKQLEIANRDIKNLQLYNDTLKIMYDNIRAFKHDFHNIVNGIGGYITAKDIDGLEKYYKSLFNDCNNINNLSALNPEIINNPSIYAILADKYTKANSKNIQIELGIFLDLNSLNIDTYELTRILGILLDNSIEAAQECERKYISVRFLMDNRMNRQLIIVENTYNNKDVDTYKIFEKSYTTKPHNTGLGLWEVNKILKKNDNLAIFTSKDDELFKQQLEIYLPKKKSYENKKYLIK